MPAHQQCASLHRGFVLLRITSTCIRQERSVEIIYSEPVATAFSTSDPPWHRRCHQTLPQMFLRSRSRFRNLSSHAIQVPELLKVMFLVRLWFCIHAKHHRHRDKLQPLPASHRNRWSEEHSRRNSVSSNVTRCSCFIHYAAQNYQRDQNKNYGRSPHSFRLERPHIPLQKNHEINFFANWSRLIPEARVKTRLTAASLWWIIYHFTAGLSQQLHQC